MNLVLLLADIMEYSEQIKAWKKSCSQVAEKVAETKSLHAGLTFGDEGSPSSMSEIQVISLPHIESSIIKKRKKPLASGYEKGKIILVFYIPFPNSLDELFGLIIDVHHKSYIETRHLSRQQRIYMGPTRKCCLVQEIVYHYRE